ncbi:hypothetical protein M876_12575 [Elizabethkingia anophelis FMS-007]|nr:hypothetical protein M876_12575 [Elizabethkingia anophelis FMS-007]
MGFSIKRTRSVIAKRDIAKKESFKITSGKKHSDYIG